MSAMNCPDALSVLKYHFFSAAGIVATTQPSVVGFRIDLTGEMPQAYGPTPVSG